MRTDFTDQDQRHWQNFVQCVPDLAKFSNRISDLKPFLHELWPVYCEPLVQQRDLGMQGFLYTFLRKMWPMRVQFTQDYLATKSKLELR